jgi:hypothetical protein
MYLTFKCPDALEKAIEQLAEDNIGASDDPEKDAQLEIEFEELVEKLKRQAEKWFRYGEAIKLRIDFENGTCTVLPVKDW